MPENLFEQNLNNPVPSNDEIVKEIDEINEKEYLAKIKKKNKKYLIDLDLLERERVARYIVSLYNQNKERQDKLSDEIDNYDDVYRMKPITIKEDDGSTPNYRSGLSTTNLEVIHSNIMNVFFTPKDILRVIPTEEGDIPKIKKLDIFGNWSMKNELKLEENCDRLFHSSGKNGTNPYMVHWVKEYGTEIKVELLMNPANPREPLIDTDTKEPLTQEREVSKLLYNGPKLEVFSRKDYIVPENAVFDKTPDWEMRRLRMNADKVKRNELEGKYYSGIFDTIGGWGGEQSTNDNASTDKEGQSIPLGDTEKIFIEFCGRLRIKALKADENNEEQYEELEDEFIGIIEITSETLCQLKKNKFPLKMRPYGLDVFIPDDEGRLDGIGVMEFLDGPQNAYDLLYNQYLLATTQANSPVGFFTPLGNTRDEPIKIKHGYMYPTSDTASVKFEKLPPPDQSLILAMEETRNQAQLLLGIGDYSAGLESKIDPTAPAKKAELVVAQGNNRLNRIIQRRNKTLKDIFKRWFLLYQANMPANKFMRIAGEDKNNPWKFEKIELSDFALNSLPDFELTGNILNSNKALEAQKKIAIYDKLSVNPFFSPQTQPGMLALHSLTKWLIDGLDETGLSGFLPAIPSERIFTPQEENARFLQGDELDPPEREDFVYHIRTHGTELLSPTMPDSVKTKIADHIRKTVDNMKKSITQQIVTSQLPNMQGGRFGNPAGTQATPPTPQTVLSGAGLGRPEAGNPANVV